jgi:hypothetical protein
LGLTSSAMKSISSVLFPFAPPINPGDPARDSWPTTPRIRRVNLATYAVAISSSPSDTREWLSNIRCRRETIKDFWILEQLRNIYLSVPRNWQARLTLLRKTMRAEVMQLPVSCMIGNGPCSARYSISSTHFDAVARHMSNRRGSCGASSKR